MDFVSILRIESWTLYSIGILLVGCRMISRRMKIGSWRLQIEDWIMVVVTVCFTLVMFTVNEVAVNGSNYMPASVAASLTPEQAAAAEYGSKMTLAMEMFTLATVWLVKACLLILYFRLTVAFQAQQLAVKIIAAYCVIGYVLVVSLCLGYWCTPIWEYWAVPVRISQCATYYNHMIFATAFNISSDLMLLAIPIPIIAKSHLPSRRKIVLCCVLGIGVLNIIVAVLNRYYNFSNPDDLSYVYFYVAEVATAVYVGNIPLCWPVVQRVFHISSWARDSHERQTDPNKPRTMSTRHARLGRKKPSGFTSLWTITSLQTTWDRMEDPEESKERGPSRMGSVVVLGEDVADAKDAIELTPSWHHDANSTTIRADGRTTPVLSDDRVNVIRTVEISRAESREPMLTPVKEEDGVAMPSPTYSPSHAR